MLSVIRFRPRPVPSLGMPRWRIFSFLCFVDTFPPRHSDAHMCPCGTTIKGRTHIVGECEIHKEERILQEMRKLDECDMEECCRLKSSERTIAILGERWWPQKAKQDGDRISKHFNVIWKKRNERPSVGGVSLGVGIVPRLERDAWSMNPRCSVATIRLRPAHRFV